MSNREEAVALAIKACELTHEWDTTALLVLATVSEEAGRIADAISAAQKAMRIARADRNDRLIKMIEQQLVRLQAFQ